MKLGDICPAPCIAEANLFAVPRPGCSSSELRFGTSEGRDYFAVLLRNHDFSKGQPLSPRVAVVGLSPAANQIDAFVGAYRDTQAYGEAAIRGAFAGLSAQIIGMMEGLGLITKLGLSLRSSDSFARHPDILVTSLVACATLATSGSSNDFDPAKYEAARRCMGIRFVGEVLDPRFQRLNHVVVLGAQGWSALDRVKAPDGRSVRSVIQAAGKTLVNLPHPSGQNQELVNLATLPTERFPPLETYVRSRWDEYKLKPSRPGRGKQGEETYRAKRQTSWMTVDALRKQIALMSDTAA